MLAVVVAVLLLLAMTGRSLSFHAAGVSIGQCQRPVHTLPVTAPSYEPVWRTFTDTTDGFSLSLPATWDGTVAGGPVPTGSPWLGDDLQRMLAASDSTVKFVAAGRPGAQELFVSSFGALPGASINCALTLSSDVSGRVGAPTHVREGRIHLLAGDASETVDTVTESVGGRMVDYVDYRFALLRGSPRNWLALDFTAPRDEASQAEPVFWQIAESLRLRAPVAGPGAVACLVTTPTRPDVLSPAGGTCAMPIGQSYFRFDCTASVLSPTSMRTSAFAYDLSTGRSTAAAQLSRGDGACRASVPAGHGMAILLPDANLANVAVAIDFVAASESFAYVGLAARRSGSDEIYATYDVTTGSVAVWQKQTGQATRVASGLASNAPTAVHRLLLFLNGGQEITYLDDELISHADNISLTQAGAIEAYMANPDPSATATFDILRFVVYQPPTAG
jgi:hypothetical protein